MIPFEVVPTREYSVAELKEEFEQLKSNVDLNKAQSELSYDDESIEEAMQKQAGLYFYYSLLRNQAKALYERADILLGNLKADRDLVVRKYMVDKNMKITDAAVKATVERSDSVRELNFLKLEIGEVLAILDTIVKALEHKKDMMTQTSANHRRMVENNFL